MILQESKMEYTISDFMKKHLTYETQDATHTKIGSREHYVFGGKYNIPPEDLDEFYELYYNHIFNNNNPGYYTEKQNNDIVAIDLDFRYKIDITTRQHTSKMTMDFIKLIADAIKNICNIQENTEIPFYITERDECVVEKNITKDGIHIIIGVKINNSIQKYIRDYCLSENRMRNIFKSLPLTNTDDNIFDKCVFNKTNNFMLYGSTKPGYEPYKMSGNGIIIYDDEIIIKTNDKTMNSVDLLKKMSVQTDKLTVTGKSIYLNKIEQQKQKKQKKITLDNGEYKYDLFTVIENKKQLEKEHAKIYETFDKKLQKLVKITLHLPLDYADDYTKWIRVGWALHNTDKRLFLTWQLFSSKSDKFDVNDIDGNYEAWENFKQEEGLTYKSIKMWSRNETPEFYNKIYNEVIEDNMEDNMEEFDFDFNNITNASISKLFIKLYGNDFVYNMKKVYHWNGDIWNNESADSVIQGIIQGKMYMKLHNKCFKTQKQEDLSRMLKQLTLLLNRTFREKTYKDIVDKLKIKSSKYIFNFTPDQVNNIHFRNGVLQLDKITDIHNIMGAFRKRVKTDFVSGYNDYDFIEPSKNVIDEVTEIYKKIMINTEHYEYFLSFLAYCLTGNTEQQICEFDIGYRASNGKSTHTEIHNCAMPFYTHKLNTQTFNENFSKVHKQFIKLFEKPIRLAVMNELKTQKLDATLFKDFVDGEELNVEKMYGTSFNRKTQAKLKVSSNYDPHFDGDNGVLRRGIKLDFESIFTDEIIEDDWNKKIFVKDLELLDKFRLFDNKNEYCSAYIYMLCPYAMKYLKNKRLTIPKELRDGFKSAIMEYDTVGTLIKSKLIECYDDSKMTPHNKVGKKLLTDMINEEGIKISWRNLLSKMKTLGYVYNKALSYKYEGKNTRGRFENVIFIEELDDDIDD